MADTVLLDLKTVVERPLIRIDDVLHELVAPGELSLAQSQRLGWLGRRFDKLAKQDEEPGEKQLGDLSRLLAAMADIVMVHVPAEARAKLTEADIQSVIEVFTTLSLARKARLAGGMAAGLMEAAAAMTGEATETAATGARASPGSSASMAATPPAG